MTKSKWLKATLGLTLLASLSGNLFGANPGDVIVTEIMQNPSAVSDNNGEYFEVYNTTTSAINIDGWVMRDNGSNTHTIDNGGSLMVPANGYLVLGLNSNTATNGGVSVDYQYSSWSLANGDDEVILEEGGIIIDEVYYDGGPNFPDPTGISMELLDINSDNNVGANWAEALSAWTGSAGDFGSPGTVNTVANADFPPTASNVTRNPQVPSSSDLVTISAELTDDGSLTTASSTKQLFYNTGSGFISTSMLNSSGDNFDGVIPPQADGTIVNYYVSVTDIGGQTTTSPSDAPVSFYSYQVNNSGTTPALVINEILYNNGGGFEFIEIFNNTGATVDLSFWLLSDGFNVWTIPSGTSVNNNSFIVFTDDVASFSAANPSVTNVVGDVLFGLSSGGESVVLMDINEVVADQVDYENGTNSWPSTNTDFSIELLTPSFDNNQGASWKTSDNAGGTPGTATIADLTAPSLISASAIGLTSVDVQFDENLDQATAETLTNYSIDNGIGNPTAATLDGTDNSLVHLTVSSLSAGINYTISVSGVEDISGNASTLQNASFNYVVPPSVDDVIVNEIMYNTPSVDEEWLELYNTTGSPIVLTSNWTINSTNPSWSYSFNGETIPANGFLTIQVGSSGAFPFTPDVVFSSSSNQLVNSSSTLSLKFLTITVDEVTYDDGAPWPTSADGQGPSLELNSPALDNNDGTNWSASANAGGTPGTQNSTLATAAPDPVAISVTVSGNDIILTWSASTGATAYDVYRKASPDFGTPPSPSELVAGDIAGVSYIDSGAATSGVTFYYIVVAKN
ncbi:MAG: lamin tail domain-containing protein [Calditrichaeota bacterium]|nr:MAG: lamin tail domain-containing protein [Calditrichota bacterium]